MLFVLPTARPVTPQNMNYAIVAVGGIIVLIVLAWFGWGRRSFKGPVATATMEQEEHEREQVYGEKEPIVTVDGV